MISKCVTGKKVYATEVLAEDALIEAHVRFHYSLNQGPVAIYKCEDCGYYHFTSKGTMNDRLKTLLQNGTIARLRDATNWEMRLNKKR